MGKRSRCASPGSIRSPGVPRSCCQAIDPAACPHWRETAIGGAPAADPRADPGSAPPFGHRRLHRWRQERCPGSLLGTKDSPRRRPPAPARSIQAIRKREPAGQRFAALADQLHRGRAQQQEATMSPPLAAARIDQPAQFGEQLRHPSPRPQGLGADPGRSHHHGA
jgi:hypothetical protein